MSIWNKILVGLIIVASVAFFYIGARALKTHQYWRELAHKHELKIDQVQKDNVKLLDGKENPNGPSEMGIRQLRMELNKLLVDRRRVWFQCSPRAKLNRQEGTAEITVTTDQPDPGIAEGTILNVFEEADVRQKGRYLGEFKATKPDEKQKTVVLTPVSRLTPRELKRLAEAKQPWVMYEVMPRDNHDVFASLSDDDKKAMLQELSAESLQEYLKDGQPATKDDPKERVVDDKYVRAIRDYEVLFGAARMKYTLLADQVDAATRDDKLIREALELANQQEEAVKKDVELAKQDLTKFARERDAVATYRTKIQQEVDAAKAAITRLIESNKAMAGQIAKVQLEAARRIDQRTRAMAQSGSGG
jgi:hypothetical protein